MFGQSNLLIESTKKVGDDTRVFNGVDATVTIRRISGFTLSASTSTGKVVNDWCAIRAAVPEATYAGVTGLLNPYCHVESPIQTSFRVLATYTIPRIDVLVSSVYQDKPNVGTDQLARPRGQLHAGGGGSRGSGNRRSDDRCRRMPRRTTRSTC